MPSQQQANSALNTTIAPWIFGLPESPAAMRLKALYAELSYGCQTYSGTSSAARTPAAGVAAPSAAAPRARNRNRTAAATTARKTTATGTTTTRRRTAAGQKTTSDLVLEKITIGGPGVTQAQIRMRLPKVFGSKKNETIRPNVVGRIVEAAATKGAVIKEGQGVTAKYYRAAETTGQRAAA
jgi:biotin carboxyl carrier protein